MCFKREVNVCYTPVSNAGDSINPLIVDKVMGYIPKCTNQLECDISGIGSGLRRFFVNENDKKNPDTIIYLNNRHILKDQEIILWSAGFINTPNDNETPISNRFKIASVRGNLSKKHVNKIIGKDADCTVGDGGLLASKLIKNNKVKKYRLGIIPHRSEKGEGIYRQIRDENRNSVIIDIESDNVLDMLKIISECEVIISSSLHGLIFADSFCIPNKHVVLTDKLSGDGFKFKDYYSTYDLEDKPQNLNINSVIDIDSIQNEYCITWEKIFKLQMDIMEAFRKFLW